jgi:hypothetical protein
VLPGGEPVRRRRGNVVVSWLTSTDHKVIGNLYLISTFGFFLLGGIMAMVIHAELARPGTQLVTNEQYNQLFTMHGTIMGERGRAETVVSCAGHLAAANPGSASIAAAARHARGPLERDPGRLRRAAAEYPHPWPAASASEDAGVLQRAA